MTGSEHVKQVLWGVRNAVVSPKSSPRKDNRFIGVQGSMMRLENKG